MTINIYILIGLTENLTAINEKKEVSFCEADIDTHRIGDPADYKPTAAALVKWGFAYRGG